MELTLSKKGDYAVRAAIALARAWGSGAMCKVREVSEQMNLPPLYTAQILHLLSDAGLAEARAGKRGGYMLLRDPAAISLLEVVEAAEGVLRAKRCTLRGGPCQWEQMCPLHPAWERATMAFRESLRQASLAEVAAVDVALEEGTAEILPTSHRLHPKADMV